MVDVVYALHTFEAENEDELTFEAGERIIVLERDDQYSDGWFQVRPTRSAVFPDYAPCSPVSQRQQLHRTGAEEVGVPSRDTRCRVQATKTAQRTQKQMPRFKS